MASHLSHDVSEIVVRDLASLAEEVQATSQAQLWIVPDGLTNSVGTLALHLCGNLRHFIGAALGGDGYQRDRDAEFGRRDVSKEELLAEIQLTQEAVHAALEQVQENQLQEPMSVVPPRHEGRSVGFFLVQLCCHLSWHRGQLNYLRRILQAGN